MLNSAKHSRHDNQRTVSKNAADAAASTNFSFHQGGDSKGTCDGVILLWNIERGDSTGRTNFLNKWRESLSKMSFRRLNKINITFNTQYDDHSQRSTSSLNPYKNQMPSRGRRFRENTPMRLKNSQDNPMVTKQMKTSTGAFGDYAEEGVHSVGYAPNGGGLMSSQSTQLTAYNHSKIYPNRDYSEGIESTRTGHFLPNLGKGVPSAARLLAFPSL